MLLRTTAFAALVLAASPAHAMPPPDTRPAECAVQAGSTVLHPWSDALPTHQRAAWLNATQLRWAAPANATVVLLQTPSPHLRLVPGAVPEGNARRHPLTPIRLRSVDARFSHVPGATFELATPLLPEAWRETLVVVALDAEGRVLDATGLQNAGALDAVFAPMAKDAALGATIDSDTTRFALWAPTATNVSLCLFDDADAPDATTVLAIEAQLMGLDAASGVWTHTVPADLRGRRYAYLVDVLVPGIGLVRNRVTDPYALGLNADSRESVVLDLDDPATKPEGWGTVARPATVKASTDLVVYELHVRDFSRDDTGVPAPQRGKYLAFTLSGSPGMTHLAALARSGVTDVHLLPTYDLATVPERDCAIPVIPRSARPDNGDAQAAIEPLREIDCFNWGYDPWHYTVPEGSYATDPDDAAGRVREFRTMVQALHAAGLRVGLDVVYNHTMASGQDRQSVLDRVVPGYYHRLDAEGRVTTSTCCANTATEATMMAKLMIDSVVVWARDYGVDSFRFDLMGHQPKAAMLELQDAVNAASGRHIHLLGEGWNFGEVANGARFEQAAQGVLNGTGIGTFSDRMRDAARGGRAGDRGEALFAQGWLSGLHLAPNAANASRDKAETETALRAADELVRIGLAGSVRDYVMADAHGTAKPLSAFSYGDQPAGFVSAPGEAVNYTENHDNLTLFDSNALRLPIETSRHDRARAQVLGNALVLLSQGIAYLHAGQEILRSKSLDRNSFNSGDAFNRLDWTLQDNGFGIGLPPPQDNQDSWPQMQPVLARTDTVAPRPEDLRFALDWTLALLQVRRDSPLLRLTRTDEVIAALRFENTGKDALPGLVVGHLDGGSLPPHHPAGGSGELLYALNTAPEARRLRVDALKGSAWSLHPALPTIEVDPRLADARLDAGTGELVVPGRTVLVFVR